MEQMLAFISNHLALWGSLAVIAVLLVALEIRVRVTGPQQLSPQAVTRLMNHDNASVVDIRPVTEFQAGHILGAKHMPLEQLARQEGTSWQQPVIVICANGTHSPGAASQLQDKGVARVYCLAGGLEAWQQAQLPLAK